MSTITEVREAIAETLTANQINGYPTIPNGPVNCPAVIVQPAAGQPVTMGRGVTTYRFDLICLASTADTVHGQEVLDEMLTTFGDRSVYALIFADKSCGQTNPNTGEPLMEVVPGNWSDYGEQTFGGVDYIGAVISTEVHTRGTT